MATLSKQLSSHWQAVPKPIQALAGHLASIVVGILIAAVLHYALYRMGLPSKPFIYVAF